MKPDGREIRSLEARVGIGIVPANLSQNFPNPFNPGTKITYFVDEETDVSLRIYDVTGRFVRTLSDRRTPPGEYVEFWDGTDERGAHVESGTYFYRLVAGKTTFARKMILLR